MKKLTTNQLEERISMKEINKFCSENGLKLKSENYYIDDFPMGPGGVGQIKHMKQSNTIRVQLRCGYGKWNYAQAAVFNLK